MADYSGSYHLRVNLSNVKRTGKVLTAAWSLSREMMHRLKSVSGNKAAESSVKAQHVVRMTTFTRATSFCTSCDLPPSFIFSVSDRAMAENVRVSFSLQAFSYQWETHLLDPEFLRKGSEFYLTVAIWLQMQLDNAAKVKLPQFLSDIDCKFRIASAQWEFVDREQPKKWPRGTRGRCLLRYRST